MTRHGDPNPYRSPKSQANRAGPLIWSWRMSCTTRLPMWAIIIAGPTAIAATTCIALYGGQAGDVSGEAQVLRFGGPGMDASTADMGCSPRTLATERCSW